MSEMTSMVIALSSSVLSVIALAFAFYTAAKVFGFERSTHKIEYRPLESNFDALTDEERKAILKNHWVDDLID